MKKTWFEKGKIQSKEKQNREFQNKEQGISMVALVVTIALNCLRSGRKLECVA